MRNQSQPEPLYERPLPDNVDAERLLLGAIMTDAAAFLTVAADLTADDFSLEKHKRLFLRMADLHERGEHIDRVTLTNELLRQGQLQSVGGLSYVTSLDEGLPQLVAISGYIAVVKEKSLLRKLINNSQLTINRCLSGESATAILQSSEEALLRLGNASVRDGGPQSIERIIEQYPGGPTAFLDPAARVQGLKTGFTRFDDMTGGLRGGDLILLAARPAMGKTACALNIAYNVASHLTNPKAVAVFSLEMSKESLLTRLLCSQARIDHARFRAGYLTHEEREQLQETLYALTRLPILLDDKAGTNLFEIHSKIRRLKAEYDLGLIIIDYLQLMQGKGATKEQEVSEQSRGCKIMAKDENLPMLVLSQLSRAPETRPGDHRPQLSDLRSSGSLEQDCDMAAFLYREEVYRPDKDSVRGIAELLLLKQREGPTGRIKLAFLSRYTKFENLTTTDDNPYE